MGNVFTLPSVLNAVASLLTGLAVILFFQEQNRDNFYAHTQKLALEASAGDIRPPAGVFFAPVPIAPPAPPTTEAPPALPAQEKALPPSTLPAAVLVAPAIGLRVVVFYGVTQSDLKRGPGFFPGRSDPVGRVAIAGHLGESGGPFARIGRLSPGDEIALTIQGRQYVYAVQGTYTVHERDWTLITHGEPALVLQACIIGRREQRLIVVAAPVP